MSISEELPKKMGSIFGVLYYIMILLFF